MAAVVSTRRVNVLANQMHVVHRNEAPKETIQSLKFGDRKSEWVCIVCSRGFKDEKAAGEHISAEIHKIKIKDGEISHMLLKLVPPSEEEIACMTDFLEPIFRKHSACRNNKIREGIARELEVFLQMEFSDVSVGLHGSSASEFALQTSDVNIYLSIPEAESRHQNRIAVVMRRVAAILRREAALYSEVLEDYYAYNKIPRIIFRHKQSKLAGEIRVNVGNPLSLAFILHLYHSIDFRVHQLGVLFRYWAKVCLVDSQVNGHYPAHMFIVMVLHYLQQRTPPVVPVIHEMFPELKQKDQPSNSDSAFITEEVALRLMDELALWKSENSEPLGQLWLGLFKYYAVDFQVEKYAVSILHSELLHRENTDWGFSRLAVQDPMIPRSNLARAASSDKVFWYLWSCVKQSAVYFYDLLAQLEYAEEEAKSHDRVLLEDETLSLTRRPDQCAAESGQFSSAVEDISAAFQSLSTRDSVGDPGSVASTYQSALTASTDPEDYSATVVKERDDSADDVVSSVDQGAQVCVHAPDIHTPDSGKPQRKKRSNEFEVDNLAYEKYPLVCLGCRRLHHNIINCPSEKLPLWRFPKDPSQASLKSIKRIFGKYLRDTILNEQDARLRQEICGKILSHVRSIYPDAKLELFGSSANGFSSYKSDLDICVVIPEVSTETLDKAGQIEIIEVIAKRLKKYKDYHDVTTITTARVPIIKFYLPEYRLECDISLENRLALRNTKLIFAYASFDERVRYLGYAVKHFAKTCDMGDASTGSLSSYAYILMAIHYLQRTDPPVIPCLQQIPSDHPEGPWISDWNCYFYENNSDHLGEIWPHYRKNQESVGQLWLGFLKYYLTFDWVKEVVTIRQTHPLSKFDKWWFSKLMCIEDPFNLDHNLAAAVGGKMRQYILERFYCALCYHSRDIVWKDIGYLFDTGILVGAERAPKFLICNYCNSRGHKAASCPSKRQHEKGQKSVSGKQQSNSVTGSSAPILSGPQQAQPVQLQQQHPLVPTPAQGSPTYVQPVQLQQQHPSVPTPARRSPIYPQQGPPLLPTPAQGSPTYPQHQQGPPLLPPSPQLQQGPSLLPTPAQGSPTYPQRQQGPPLLPPSPRLLQGLPPSPQPQQGYSLLHASPQLQQGHPSSAISARMAVRAQATNLSPSVAEMLQYHSAVQSLHYPPLSHQPAAVPGTSPTQQLYYQQSPYPPGQTSNHPAETVVRSSSSSSSGSGLQAPPPSTQQRIQNLGAYAVPGSSYSQAPNYYRNLQEYVGSHQQYPSYRAQPNRHHDFAIPGSTHSHAVQQPDYQSLQPYVVQSSSPQQQQHGLVPSSNYSQVPGSTPRPVLGIDLQHQAAQHNIYTTPPDSSGAKHQPNKRARKRK